MTLASKLARLIDEKGREVKAEDLSQFAGVGDAKATLILAAIEFARRRIKPEGAKIQTPADLLPNVRNYADRKQEHFLCASINGENEILNIRVVSIGLIDWQPRASARSLRRCSLRSRFGCYRRSQSPQQRARTRAILISPPSSKLRAQLSESIYWITSSSTAGAIYSFLEEVRL